MKLTTAAQMKELDRQAIEERGIPSIDLMERAAAGVAEAALALLPKRPGKCRGAALCGAGNNGGDGIAAARLLFLKGLKVRAFLVGDYEKLTPDALEETRRLSECGVELERFDPADESQRAWVLGCDVVIDALFGVGLSRPIGAGTPFAAAVDWMNESRAAVVAADIASGVSADTGAVLGRAVRADRTVTFTLPKIGQAVGEGAVLSGNVEVRDIGIPADLVRGLVCRAQTVERDFARAALPPRRADGHKGTFGRVLIIGGAVGYTGAPYLTAAAAVRTGCGLVSLGVPETIWPVEAAKCVSAMPFPLPDKHGRLSPKAKEEILERAAGCDAVALGPGLGRGDGVTELVLDLLQKIQQPMVLDADGINALGGHIDVLDARRDRITVLTPHDGEFARIGGDLTGSNRLGAARAFGAAHGCVLVLKGHRTLTAAPAGNVLVNTTGNSGLAKGGSGDVLTGIVAALLAQGATAVRAAAVGVWLHGRAGDLALWYDAGGRGVVTAGGHRGDPIKDGGFCGAQMGLRTNDDPVPAADGLRRHRRRGGGCGGCPDALSEHGGLRHGGGGLLHAGRRGLGGHAPVRLRAGGGDHCGGPGTGDHRGREGSALRWGSGTGVRGPVPERREPQQPGGEPHGLPAPADERPAGRVAAGGERGGLAGDVLLPSDGGPDRRAEWEDPLHPLAAAGGRYAPPRGDRRGWGNHFDGRLYELFLL